MYCRQYIGLYQRSTIVKMIKHLVSLSRGQRVDIVDVQCYRRGSHTSQEILAQERGLQGGKGGKLLLKNGIFGEA